MIEHTSMRQVAGAIMFVLGMALLILSAADYLLGWNLVSSAGTAIGIVLVAVGARITRHERTHTPH